MALRSVSMFLYGLEVVPTNQNLPFKASMGGSELNAVLRVGYYSLSSIATEIEGAMKSADPANNYTVTIDRTFNGGTENRLTISTDGTYLDLLFSSGSTAASSCRDLIGYGIFDYTGATSYQNGVTTGTSVVTDYVGYNYQPQEINRQNFGSINVSANGTKETITWNLQRFIGVEYKYEPETKVMLEWSPLIDWMIAQKPFDFTPEIDSPTIVYDVTLEKSATDGKGLGFNMREMLPAFPFYYQTGALTFRIRPED